MVGGGKPLITPHHSHRPSYACCWLQLPTPAPHSLSVSVHFHSQLSASVRPGPPELCSSTMTPACVCGVHMNLKIFTLKSGEWWTWCVVAVVVQAASCHDSHGEGNSQLGLPLPDTDMVSPGITRVSQSLSHGSCLLSSKTQF